jgi:hypothetical protein
MPRRPLHRGPPTPEEVAAGRVAPQDRHIPAIDDPSAIDLAEAVNDLRATTPTHAEAYDEDRVPEHPFAAELNGRYPGFPFGNEPGPLSRQDAVLVEALVQRLGRMFRNANVTAAEPAHVRPNVWALPVDLSGRVNVPAAVGGWQTITQQRIDLGYWCRIDGYGFDVLDAAYTYNGSLLWRVQVDGKNVPTVFDIAEHRGTVVRPRQVYVKVEQEQTVALQVRRAVAAAAAQDVDGCLTGWRWRLRNNYEGTRAATTAY